MQYSKVFFALTLLSPMFIPAAADARPRDRNERRRDRDEDRRYPREHCELDRSESRVCGRSGLA